MTRLLILLATNAIVATGLLGPALLADRFLRWPAVRHLFWVAVLLPLLLPPVIPISVAPPEQPPLENTVAAPDAIEDETASPTVEPSSPSIAALLMAIEVTGTVFFLALALTRSRRMFRRLRSTRPASDALQQRARRLADNLGLRRLPRIRVTDERTVPMLIALPIPTIVLSRPLIEALESVEVDALLSHELAHVKRGDAWLRPVEMLATALYWWLPTLWIARRRLRLAEEAACDSIVVSVNPAAKRAYAESLVKAIELTTPLRPSALVTGSADSRHIKERITMILKDSNHQTPRVASRLAAGFALLAVLVGPTWAPAQQAPDETGSASTEPGTDPLGGRARLERDLIEMRLQSYTLENRIRQLELRQEAARAGELFEASAAVGDEAGARESQRSLERLELELEHLDVELNIHQLETELALQQLELTIQGASGAPSPPEDP